MKRIKKFNEDYNISLPPIKPSFDDDLRGHDKKRTLIKFKNGIWYELENENSDNIRFTNSNTPINLLEQSVNFISIVIYPPGKVLQLQDN